MSKSIEKGDIYFLYRPKVDVDKPRNLDDVQRLHLVLLPDNGSRARLFIVGKKYLPDIRPGESSDSERGWLMTYLVAKPETIGDELKPLEYETKTRGKQDQGEAIPVGEGRYCLFQRKDSSRLAYALSNPSSPGKVQELFGIRREASYVVSVRNPDIDVPGFPKEKPDYPDKLKKKFADERWIDISDAALLDYENAQLVMIGAHESLKETEADIAGKPDLFGRLGLKRSEWPTEALTRGVMAEAEYEPEAKEPRGDKTRAGERGGNAATSAASAAGIAKALAGAKFPEDRDGLVDYAKKHNAKGEIINVLNELPKRQFENMAEVEKAVGEVR